MNNEAKKLIIEARITWLTSKGPHNNNIVNKLKRQLRKL